RWLASRTRRSRSIAPTPCTPPRSDRCANGTCPSAASQRSASFAILPSFSVEQESFQRFDPFFHARKSLVHLLHKFGFLRREVLALSGRDPFQDFQCLDEDAPDDGRQRHSENQQKRESPMVHMCPSLLSSQLAHANTPARRPQHPLRPMPSYLHPDNCMAARR